MTLPYHVWYRLVRRQWDLAAEVAAATTANRAWATVYPLGESKYHIHYFEVPKDLVERMKASNDADLFFVNEEHIDVVGEEELERVLARWLDNLELLVQPYFAFDRE